MLHAKILRSPHPHARILSIDASEATKLAGVKAVVTFETPDYFAALGETDEAGNPVDSGKAGGRPQGGPGRDGALQSWARAAQSNITPRKDQGGCGRIDGPAGL